MSLTPCTLCAFTKNGESPFKLYEFTDEALAVLESMKTITRVGIIYVADVYRGGSSRNKAKVSSFILSYIYISLYKNFNRKFTKKNITNLDSTSWS